MRPTSRINSISILVIGFASILPATMYAASLSGTVFEDVNYGGGAGRGRAASGGIGRPGARVELYNALGNFVATVSSNASGLYMFTGIAAGNYTVRVVNSTVTSSRSGYIAGLLPVQTFRTNASTGTPVNVSDRVGGEDPTKADAGNGSTSLAALTTGTTTAQSITTVTVGAGDVSGLDFGFNFNTVVNVNNSGQGSLRQFISNSNALGNSGLAIQGQPAGADVSIFMISDGQAHPGLRAGLANQLTSGVAVISLSTALPAISGANTTIDGRTQTALIGNTNAAVLGTGGMVGVDGLILNTVAGPEVEIRAAAALPVGIRMQGNNATVRGLAIHGFGANNGEGGIVIDPGVSGSLIEDNVLGTTAASFSDPGAAQRGHGGIHSNAGIGGTIRNNLVGYHNVRGISIFSGSSSWTIAGNEVRNNGFVADGDGISIDASAGNSITGNLFVGSSSQGIVVTQPGASNNVITNNTVTGNGVGIASSNVQSAGITIRSGVASTLLDRNVVRANYGAGIQVNNGAMGTHMTRNSFSDNGTIAARNGGGPTGQIGIDLNSASDDINLGTSPFHTPNDTGDSDSGGNGLLNSPVIATAQLAGSNLILSGFARPGSIIEFFIADGDPSGFGEGKTYITTLTEGSGSDADTGSGTYTNPVNGLNQGTDNTNRFRFTLPVTGGIGIGTVLTSTATLGGDTSEFSGNVAVTLAGTNVSGTVYRDANHNLLKDASESGTGLTLYAKLISAASPSGPATQAVPVDPSTGIYTFNNVTPGSYIIFVDTGNTLADVTPTLPAGWIGTEQPNQIRSNVAVAAAPLPDQNFGLFPGSAIRGTVFLDLGSGTGGMANDGIKNGTEIGIAAVPVKITDNAGAVIDSAVTDGAGNYSLYVSGISGSLKIVETNAPAHVSTGASTGTTGGTYDRPSDTVTFNLAAGTSYSGVNFGDVPANLFASDGQLSGLPGSIVVYSHTFTAGSSGQIAFSTAGLSSPVNSGWSHVLYRDSNCDRQLDPADPVITAPIAVIAGQALCVLLKEFVPGNATFGASDRVNLTGSFTYTGAAPPLSASSTLSNLTIVGTPGLALVKTVDKPTARPGEIIAYTITYTNNSSEPLSDLVIYDQIPAYTTFASAGYGSLPASLTAVVITSPVIGATGAIKWTFSGTLAVGSKGTVTYVVTISP